MGYSELVQRLFEKMTFFLVDPLPEWHPSKMREVGGASSLMAAVRFKNTTINQ